MLQFIAWTSIAIAFACAGIVLIDVACRPQKMWIMNIVWPVTCLYLGAFALWGYMRYGRIMSRIMMEQQQKKSKPRRSGEGRNVPKEAAWHQIAIATSHCGAGCALADIVTEFTVFALGLTILGIELWASFLWDFVAAWSLGIVFQYFTIKPMRDLTPMQGIRAAIKADTLSILAFQVGMYAWMALVFFKLFPSPHLHPNQPEYWLMMQVGMALGFATSFPMNRWLVARGWKDAMG